MLMVGSNVKHKHELQGHEHTQSSWNQSFSVCHVVSCFPAAWGGVANSTGWRGSVEDLSCQYAVPNNTDTEIT